MISADLLDGVTALFLQVVKLSWQASIVALLVLSVQAVLGRRLPALWRHALWGIVFLRLVLPAVPGSVFSVFNVVQAPRSVSRVTPVRMDIPLETTMPAESARPFATIAPREIPVATNPETSNPVAVMETRDSAFISGRGYSRFLLSAALVWLVGSLLLTIRMAFVAARLRRDISRMALLRDVRVLQLFDQCCLRIGLRYRPKVVVGPAGSEAGVTGVMRPTLILPEHVLNGLPESELRHILMHELVHISRSDVLWNWATLIVCQIHWFNPVVWFVRFRANLDAELACDSHVLAMLPATERTAYGITLLRLLEDASTVFVRRLPVSMLGDKRSLHRRMTMIARYRAASFREMLWGVAVTLLLIAAGLTGALTPASATGQSGKVASEEGASKKPLTAVSTAGVVPAAGVVEPEMWLSGSPSAELAAAQMALVLGGFYAIELQDFRKIDTSKKYERVFINGTNIKDADLERLAAHPEIQRILIYNTNIQGPGLERMASLSKLEELILLGAQCTDKYLAALPQMPELKWLRLVGCAIGKQDLAVLKKCPNLTHLELVYVPVDEGMQYLREVPRLTYLQIKNTDLSDAGVKHLKFVPKLQSLTIQTMRLSDEELVVLEQLKELQEFSLAAAEGVQGPGLAHLLPLKKLATLTFSGRGATDTWVQAVEPLRGITSLEFSHTLITGHGLAPLKKWSNVKHAHFYYNEIDDDGIDVLADVERFRNLDFKEGKMTHVGRQQLRDIRTKMVLR